MTLGALAYRQLRACGAVPRHNGGGDAGQQQGFIAHLRGVWSVHQQRTRFAAAIAAGEEETFFARAISIAATAIATGVLPLPPAVRLPTQIDAARRMYRPGGRAFRATLRP